jgi:hypothetical protein
LQERFLTLIRQLPSNWRNKHGTFEDPAPPRKSTSPAQQRAPINPSDLPRTPLHLLGQAARGGKEPGSEEAEQDLEHVRRSRFGGGRQSLPWCVHATFRPSIQHGLISLFFLSI